MTPRPIDWVAQLQAYLHEHRATPFVWGQHDCARFAAGWVARMWGEDPMAQLSLPAYSNERAAMRLARAHGGLEVMVCAALGDPLKPALAQRGDVVLIENVGRSVLGICTGPHAAAPGIDGVELVPMTNAILAWRV